MTTRLKTWKQIAAFLGTTQRTVMRWEAERDLPVHRMPGKSRSGVYADVSELEAWRTASISVMPAGPDMAAAIVATPPTLSPQRGFRSLSLWIAGALGSVVIAVGGCAYFVGHRITTLVPPSPAALSVYLQGVQDWNARTPGSLNLAVDEFNQAIKLDPAYADAYVGLANAYNLLPEYTVMPRSQAYPLAEQAAEKAISLNPQLASAHAALAYSKFYGDWDASSADVEFSRAIALEPDDATTQHWYGTFLHALGREPAALDHMNKALALNPSSESIQADRALILYYNGRASEAESLLLNLAKKDPNFRSPHFYLTQIYLPEGRDADYVRELGQTACLGGDLLDANVAHAAEAGLRKGGHAGMLQGILTSRLGYFKAGAGSPYDIAVFYSMLGETSEATRYLQIALDRHDDGIINAPSEKRLNNIKDTATYRGVLARLEAPA